MDQKDAATIYREAAFENAPPIKIIRLLYQGALRFLDRAEAEEPGGVASKYTYYLVRADTIVAELRFSLDPGHAPEVTANLEQLYLFVEERLRAAIKDGDKGHIVSARRVLADLLSAWTQVEVSSRG